ncbi:BspA family leucine-rich repeat surface protein [Segatella hominis]|uniref:BspA family leucine-rich repeat surface protein n=1 Tax=Segatella hominis TaxID=2518605 RepID=A0A4Y8VAB3_9BACT|nr:BspA family leucine-rich repeat surface protein [Segatella hominis]TFH78085.1 BspA family leucine-rich repeat surface protein [Segatella hominis]
MGGAKFRRFALFPLMLLMLFLLPANMVAQTSASSSKYIATYESSTQTLTFKKFVGETLPDNSVVVEDKMRVDAINKNLGNGTIVHIVFDKSFSTYKPTSLSYFFNRLTKLETITGLEYLNTEKVTDMSYMFYNCVALTSLDVTKFNTANVKNMGNMFYSCSALTSLDVTKFNTENVANMSYMFYSCSSLKSLDVTHFNTANVKNMTSMFSGCSSLTSLDVTHFNTANVTNMISMFSVCSKLTSLNVTNFNTANVKSMSHMFNSCSALTSLDITNFNTENVTNMSYMFNSCSSLTSLYLTNFNTEKVTNMERMFSDCQALTTIYTSSEFVTTQVSKSSGMFTNCEKLKGEEVWKKYKATDKTYAKIEGGYFSVGIPMVKYADGTLTFFLASKETLGENEYELNSGKNLPGWMKHTLGITKVVFDTSFANARPTSCYKWFYWCENLKQVEGIKNLNTKEVTNMVDMFCECRYLSSLDVSGFNTEKVTDMSEMFYDCISLKLLDIAKFNTANVTNMQGMFYSCSALTTIYASDKFVTGQVTDGSNMFSNCTNLKGFVDYKNNSDKTDHIFANYKTGYFSKLVGKNGDEKIGATGETLAAEKLVLADDKDFVAYEPFAAKTASYSRTMKEGTIWATLCLPFEVTLDGQNFRAFKLLSADDATETVELEEIKTSIAAGTPVIIKMKDGATQLKFSEADKAIAKDVQTSKTANSNYQLQGLYTQKMFSKDTDNNCYIVKGDKLMNPAKLLQETTTEFVDSKSFRAYMVDNSSAPAAGARMFSISGGTTAIEQLETTADSKAEYYDLQGRRLPDLQKGVNIVKRGGKTMKVIIK